MRVMLDLVVNHTAKDRCWPNSIRNGSGGKPTAVSTARARSIRSIPARSRSGAIWRSWTTRTPNPAPVWSITGGATCSITSAWGSRASAAMPPIRCRPRSGASSIDAAHDVDGEVEFLRGNAGLHGRAGRCAGRRRFRLPVQQRQVVGLPGALAAGPVQPVPPHSAVGGLPRKPRHRAAGGRCRQPGPGAAGGTPEDALPVLGLLLRRRDDADRLRIRLHPQDGRGQTTPEDWEEPKVDISQFVADVNSMRAATPAFNVEGPQFRITAPHSPVVGLWPAGTGDRPRTAPSS